MHGRGHLLEAWLYVLVVAVVSCRSEREKNQTRIEADQWKGQVEILTQGKVRLNSSLCVTLDYVGLPVFVKGTDGGTKLS